MRMRFIAGYILKSSYGGPNDPVAGDAKQRAGKLVAKTHGSVAPAVLRP
ncbi:MAG TPA: hypothetical protein PLK94_08965 [Alphaproteobacteria bacterium]|nr:hypothetical protein [Alphaproteobacteria bacterium]